MKVKIAARLDCAGCYNIGMKLTRIERWMLANQYSILEALYPKEADYYKEAKEILENGFEFEYSELCQNIYDNGDVMSVEECKEVIHILAMFDTLRYSYGQLKDKSGIEKHALDFSGFDGNDSQEGRYMSYARFLCEKQGKFEKLTKGDFFNSHSPSLEIYRRMLKEYDKLENKSQLTKEDIVSITAAKVHPSHKT